MLPEHGAEATCSWIHKRFVLIDTDPIIEIWQNSRPAYFFKDYWRMSQALDANVSPAWIEGHSHQLGTKILHQKQIDFAHVNQRDQTSEICNQGEFK